MKSTAATSEGSSRREWRDTAEPFVKGHTAGDFPAAWE